MKNNHIIYIEDFNISSRELGSTQKKPSDQVINILGRLGLILAWSQSIFIEVYHYVTPKFRHYSGPSWNLTYFSQIKTLFISTIWSFKKNSLYRAWTYQEHSREIFEKLSVQQTKRKTNRAQKLPNGFTMFDRNDSKRGTSSDDMEMIHGRPSFTFADHQKQMPGNEAQVTSADCRKWVYDYAVFVGFGSRFSVFDSYLYTWNCVHDGTKVK